MKIHYQSVFDKWEIEDRAVQAIITSPPYYSLRKYSIPDVVVGGDNKDCKHEFKEIRTPAPNTQGGHSGKSKIQSGNIGGFATDYKDRAFYSNFCIHCHAWKGQHGLEPDYKLFISHCKLWMQEAIRVLRDDGVIFVNLADSYSGSNCGSNDYTSLNRCKPESYQEMYKGQKTGKQDVKPKSKLLIPERFSIMCVDELGLILRNHIVWAKSNAMPESTKDRFSKKWESIFMLTKQEKYYFDLDDVREPHAQVSIERLGRAVSNNNKWVNGADGQTKHGLSQPRPNRNTKISKEEAEMFGRPRTGYHGATREINQEHDYKSRDPERHINEKGKNPGDVWRFKTTEQIAIEHGYNPEEICPSCSRSYKRHASRSKDRQEGIRRDFIPCNNNGANPGDVWNIPTMPSPLKHFSMWPEKLVERMILCSTKAGDIVLDPFCGSGTTLRVADRLNRVGKGLELGYKDIQDKRLSEIQKELIL